ncbi:uncharacterized protein TNCV_1832691 [Trichonephila clavipes]|nr:uncharacterized protein TNCV_1832691 [Trichonephila clavipes]
MSESSDYMELSPTKFDQVSACEKLRDTVTGISALHLSIHGMDGRSPSPGNSFMDMYISGKQAMIRRKEEMVSELKTLPPCTISDCQDHKIPSTSVEEENNFVPSPPVNENKIENKIKINSKSKKKFSKKRKQKGKDSTEEFIFPKKTARPISPTSTQDPIETNNSFYNLEQDVEHPPSIETVTTEVVTPKIPPHPIMLKIKKNFREQIKCISEKFPNLRNRIVNDVVKMFSTDHEEYRKLKHFLETDKDFEFYILKRQKDKPIKAVIKGLPNSALITDITNDLKLIGFNIDSCTQLISKRTKKSLPYFRITLPRNDLNSKIFDIKKLGYLQETEINLLIGADVLGKLLTGNSVELESGLTAVETKLGWTVFGKGSCVKDNIVTTLSMHSMNIPVNKLWELEVLGISSPTEIEKQKTELSLNDFNNRIKILPDGRYEVELP